MSESIETHCVQGGYQPGCGEPRQVPIIQSTTFKYDESMQLGELFDLKAYWLFLFSRQNPTLDNVASKICALEGGHCCNADFFWSGSKLLCRLQYCWRPVITFIALSTIYGGTFNLFAITLKRWVWGYRLSRQMQTDEEINAAFRPNTKCVFGETVANPALVVLDIERWAKRRS